MNAIALAAAFGGGLVAGRLGTAAAGRFTPPRAHRRRVPLQELATAAITTAVVARFGVGWAMVPPLVAGVSLVTLSAVDLRAYRLPDAITFGALALSLAAIALESAASGRPGALVEAAATAVGYGAVLWMAHRLRPGGLGFGDVKLGPLLGAHLGWAAAATDAGWLAPVALAAQALLASCLIALAMALVLTLLRRRGCDPLPCGDRDSAPDHRERLRDSAPDHRERLRDTALPFGPALAAGTMLAVLFPSLFVS